MQEPRLEKSLGGTREGGTDEKIGDAQTGQGSKEDTGVRAESSSHWVEDTVF